LSVSLSYHATAASIYRKMPSSRNRKKNKGKERKAKKAESERVAVYDKWHGLASGKITLGRGLAQNVECNHGLDLDMLPDISHPVSRFLHTYFMCDDIRDTLETNSEVWNNCNYRKMTADILINIGTNLALSNVERKVGNLATTIMLFENFVQTNDFYSTINSRDVATKKRDLSIEKVSISMGKRDVLKFYRKRMSCKCLKKMHLEARKTSPIKMGGCDYCGELKGRALLMVCSRCMVDQYCSRKCQVAASPGHQEDCDDYVEAEEVAVARARDLPKRNESNYILYSNCVRADVRAQNPEASFKDLAIIISTDFKSLSADERAYWDEKAAEDKERYVKEMAAYMANVTDSSVTDAFFEEEEPNVPKRNMSSFFIYANANRANMKAEYPDANFGDLAKIASTKFKGLPADERAYWDEKAAEDEVRYVTEMAAYEAAKGR